MFGLVYDLTSCFPVNHVQSDLWGPNSNVSSAFLLTENCTVGLDCVNTYVISLKVFPLWAILFIVLYHLNIIGMIEAEVSPRNTPDCPQPLDDEESIKVNLGSNEVYFGTCHSEGQMHWECTHRHGTPVVQLTWSFLEYSGPLISGFWPQLGSTFVSASFEICLMFYLDPFDWIQPCFQP